MFAQIQFRRVDYERQREGSPFGGRTRVSLLQQMRRARRVFVASMHTTESGAIQWLRGSCRDSLSGLVHQRGGTALRLVQTNQIPQTRGRGSSTHVAEFLSGDSDVASTDSSLLQNQFDAIDGFDLYDQRLSAFASSEPEGGIFEQIRLENYDREHFSARPLCLRMLPNLILLVPRINLWRLAPTEKHDVLLVKFLEKCFPFACSKRDLSGFLCEKNLTNVRFRKCATAIVQAALLGIYPHCIVRADRALRAHQRARVRRETPQSRQGSRAVQKGCADRFLQCRFRQRAYRAPLRCRAGCASSARG